MPLETVASDVAKVVTAIIEATYLVIYIVGLARNDSSTAAIVYGVGNGLLCVLGLAFQYWTRSEEKYLRPLITCFFGPIHIFSFIYGMSWFQDYTGYDVIQYARAFGPTEWLNLPLLFRVIYFNMWAVIVFLCAVGILVVLFFVASKLPRKENESKLKRLLDRVSEFFTKPRRPEPLVAISSNPPLQVLITQ